MLAGGTDDKRRNVLYSDTLTMLLEGIARLIESHHSLIDNYYGSFCFGSSSPDAF